MVIKLLNRARSYLSAGKRSVIVHSEMPRDLREEILKQIDEESDTKINAMSNVELIHLLERVMGDSLNRALGE